MSDQEKFPKVLYVADPFVIGKSNEGEESESFLAFEDVESTADRDSEVTVAIYELKEIITVVNETKVVKKL